MSGLDKGTIDSFSGLVVSAFFVARPIIVGVSAAAKEVRIGENVGCEGKRDRDPYEFCAGTGTPFWVCCGLASRRGGVSFGLICDTGLSEYVDMLIA